MNKLSFLIHILIFLITVPSVFSANDRLAELFRKRNQCPCAAAYADFDSIHASSGPFRGFVSFSQDETGCTTIFGAFYQGFEPDCNYDFTIKNGCSGTEYNITSDLNVELTNDGGTKFFSHRFDDINLTCKSDGLINCNASYYKRQRTSSSFGVRRWSGGSNNRKVRSTYGEGYAIIKPVPK
ncbi:hypothetical protein RclHR1_15250004 [Rhizophagus clarus]|uniref:Uncharacterized protein n=1 Tax=Rhizophagus clarus TaxID=94130 RepID=A0A2Z6QER3_9GLOM|nr:hypothetical protein RclHR1_15250004 [Rhizophagus clarus]GES88205.1 hypothetical protein GLOIN_2v1708636 [Rhizophagus clarus]